MESSRFYTYMKYMKSRVFCRGYHNGKRFNHVYGGYITNSRNKNNNWNYTDNPTTIKLRSDNEKFKEWEDNVYMDRETYNDKLIYINSLLKMNSNVPLKYSFHDTDKTDIFGKRMVEMRFPIRMKDNIIQILNQNYIEIYDDIGTDVKFRHKYKEGKSFNIDYDTIKVAFLDIETETKHGGIDTIGVPEIINVITLKIKGGNIYTWCLGSYKNDDSNIEVKIFTDERLMLKDFLNKWEELDIDVLSDWNGLSFDIPYIVNRIKKKLGGDEYLRLSPFRIITERKRMNRFGKEYVTYDILGINHLDYMELYFTFSHTPRDSYSLNNICQAEIGKGKLDYSEYGSLTRLYEENFQKFVDYNIRDVTIIEELDDKLQMIRLDLSIAYKCCCAPDEVSSQIRSWDCYIYSNFQHRGWVLPPRKEVSDSERGSLMGGYVKLPKTGVYSNIVSFDVNSLYPTIIRQLNLSPETITDEVDERFKELTTYSDEDDLHKLGALIDCTYDCSYLKEKNLCLSCNGNLIKRDKQGFLPEMVSELYNGRVTVKKQMKKAKQELQLVIKEIEKREAEGSN